MDKTSLEEIKNLILQKELELKDKEVEFRELARKEGEKGRNQALLALSFASVVIGIIGTIGLFSTVKNVTQNAVEEQVGSELLIRAKNTANEIGDYALQAEEVLERIYIVEKQLIENDWVDVRFQNNWTNYGGAYNPCSYVKDELGRVYLRGLIKNGDINSPIFQLPEGYRPKFKELFIAKSALEGVRVDVLPNGNVLVSESYQKWVSLDGIDFFSNYIETENSLLQENENQND